MRIQAYTAYGFALHVTIATVRPEAAPSTIFTAADYQEDVAGAVRGLLEEHKHILESALAFPAAQRLQTYFPDFPTSSGKFLFALRELKPAGSPRDIDKDWLLEIMRVRYEGMLVLLPPSFAASSTLREGKERAIEYAVKQLFVGNSVLNVFIAADGNLRPAEGTTVDVVCELGPASARMGVEIPDPLGS